MRVVAFAFYFLFCLGVGTRCDAADPFLSELQKARSYQQATQIIQHFFKKPGALESFLDQTDFATLSGLHDDSLRAILATTSAPRFQFSALVYHPFDGKTRRKERWLRLSALSVMENFHTNRPGWNWWTRAMKVPYFGSAFASVALTATILPDTAPYAFPWAWAFGIPLTFVMNALSDYLHSWWELDRIENALYQMTAVLKYYGGSGPLTDKVVAHSLLATEAVEATFRAIKTHHLQPALSTLFNHSGTENLKAPVEMRLKRHLGRTLDFVKMLQQYLRNMASFDESTSKKLDQMKQHSYEIARHVYEMASKYRWSGLESRAAMLANFERIGNPETWTAPPLEPEIFTPLFEIQSDDIERWRLDLSDPTTKVLRISKAMRRSLSSFSWKSGFFEQLHKLLPSGFWISFTDTLPGLYYFYDCSEGFQDIPLNLVGDVQIALSPWDSDGFVIHWPRSFGNVTAEALRKIHDRFIVRKMPLPARLTCAALLGDSP